MKREGLGAVPELNRQSIPVAAAATVGLATGHPALIFATLGLFVAPVSQAFGIGRGPFALMTGLSLLLGAALTPFVGQAIDRYGVRRLVLPGIAALGAVQIVISMIPVSVPVLAVLILMQGAAGCLLTPLAYTKVLSLWFHRRRGLMLGVTTAIGVGAGGGINAGLVGSLMAMGGWRLAYLGTGLYLIVVGGGVMAAFLREPPAVERSNAAAALPHLPGLLRKEAFQTLSVRLVLVFVVTGLGGIAMMTAHGPALLASRGLHIGPAFLGCVAAGSLCGQLLSGYLLDRVDSPKIGLPFACASLVGAVVILYFGMTVAIVLPAALIMGLGQGAETGLAPYYVSRFSGLRAFTGISGVLVASAMFSAGAFVAIAGFVFDKTGSYAAVMPLITALLALAVMAIVFMPRYRFAAVASTEPQDRFSMRPSDRVLDEGLRASGARDM